MKRSVLLSIILTLIVVSVSFGFYFSQKKSVEDTSLNGFPVEINLSNVKYIVPASYIPSFNKAPTAAIPNIFFLIKKDNSIEEIDISNGLYKYTGAAYFGNSLLIDTFGPKKILEINEFGKTKVYEPFNRAIEDENDYLGVDYITSNSNWIVTLRNKGVMAEDNYNERHIISYRNKDSDEWHDIGYSVGNSNGIIALQEDYIVYVDILDTQNNTYKLVKYSILERKSVEEKEIPLVVSIYGSFVSTYPNKFFKILSSNNTYETVYFDFAGMRFHPIPWATEYSDIEVLQMIETDESFIYLLKENQDENNVKVGKSDKTQKKLDILGEIPYPQKISNSRVLWAQISYDRVFQKQVISKQGDGGDELRYRIFEYDFEGKLLNTFELGDSGKLKEKEQYYYWDIGPVIQVEK